MKYDNIKIRQATENDIEQIAIIKVEGWKNAYRGIIDSDYLNSMLVSNEIEKYKSKHYSLNTVFVAELDNEILGFCRVYDFDKSPYRDSSIDCEIREIYVRPDIKRMGIGSKLFHYVLNYFKEKGKNKLYLGVFEANYNSRKFYEKMGGILGEMDNLDIDGNKYSTVSYIYILK